MQKRGKKISVILLLIILTIIGLYIFTRKEVPSESKIRPESDSTSLKLAVLPTVECLPFYVAKECGISDSLGLKIKLLEYTSSMDADTAFINKRADGIVSDMIKASIYQSEGDSVSVIMGGNIDLSLITSRQSRITDIKGLKDKIISITRHSILDIFCDKIIVMGSKDSLELNTPQINSILVRQNMILQNQIDGGILPEPYASICLSKGCNLISKMSDIKEYKGMLAIIFNDSIISSKPNELTKLIEAYNLSVDYINANKTKYKHKLLSLLSISDSISDNTYKIPDFTHAILPSSSALNLSHQLLLPKNILGKKTKTDIFNNSFISSDSLSNVTNNKNK